MSKDVNRVDTAASIQEWQKNHHHHGSEPEDRSVTARLCDGVLDLFHEAIRQLAQPHCAETASKSVRISLERARGLIALWSDGYGIQDGRLDDVLAKSRNIRRSTLKTLSSIANTIVSRLIPLTRISSDELGILTVRLTATVDEASYIIHDVIHDECDDRSDTSGDGFSEVGPDDSIAEVAEDLKTDAQCLMELDPLFRDPVLDLASHKQKQHLETINWAPETAFCGKVQQRFPKAETALVERLGRANWARFLRCQEVRNSIESGALTQANAAGNKGEDGTVAASSKYHDSGLGTSLPTASSYAETAMSYGAGDGQKVRIPPLSDEAKKGTPFPCLACGRSVRFTQNLGWKLHLYLDLKPYLCLEPQCSEHPFSTRLDWVTHLALDHRYQPSWDAITCPLCFETTEKGKLAVTRHLARHLEEISLSALPAYSDEDDDGASEAGPDEPTEASAPKKTVWVSLGVVQDPYSEDNPIRCICRPKRTPDIPFVRLFYIQCHKCKCLQHSHCMGFRSLSMVPDTYYCERCRPGDHSIQQDKDGYRFSHYLGRREASVDRRHQSPTTWEYSSVGSSLISQAKAPRAALEEADRKTSPDDVEKEIGEAFEEADRKARLDKEAEAIREAHEEEERKALLGDHEEALRDALEEADRKALLDGKESEALRKETLEERQFHARHDTEEQRLEQAWEGSRDEEQARQEGYAEMYEQDDIRQEIAVDDHLYRLEAEADYRTSNEGGEDGERDEEDETVVEDRDSRK